MEFGNIAECVADAYPLAYLWNVSFVELDEGFARWNLSLIVQVRPNPVSLTRTRYIALMVEVYAGFQDLWCCARGAE
jgi:hypothetical protein